MNASEPIQQKTWVKEIMSSPLISIDPDSDL